MTCPRRRTEAFTLVELLVVIAIIGILAGFIAVGLPRAIESAKLAKLDNTFLQIRNILTEYYVDHGTFPPAYGYLSPITRGSTSVEIQEFIDDSDNDIDESVVYFLKPWMAYMEHHTNVDLYDSFSTQFDTDRDGDISRLEFSPLGTLINVGSGRYAFPVNLYDPDSLSTEVEDDLNEQFESRDDPRPLLYFPINLRQFRKLENDWFRRASGNDSPSDPRPVFSPGGSDVLANLTFPPPNYDAYVLMSVGPTSNTWKMVTDLSDFDDERIFNRLNPNSYRPQYYYHILGLTAYFMATRDSEKNGEGDNELDFDFTARTKRGQARNDNNKLPDFEGRRAAGPVIFVGEG